MSSFITGVEKRKIKFFLKKTFETFHIKTQIYKILMKPSQEKALKKLRKIMDNSSPIKPSKHGKKIIFNSIDGRYMLHTYNEVGIAKALQLRGHNVKMVICGGIFKTCVGHFTVKKPQNNWSCKNCVDFSKKFYETTQVPYAEYTEYIDEKEINDIREKVYNMSIQECEKHSFKGINVGFHAKISADRYFVGTLPDKKTYEHMLREELINSIITTFVAESILKKEKPDILVTSHGCYSHWGSFSDYFLNHNKKVRVWFTGYRGDTLIFDQHKLTEYFKKYYNDLRTKKPLDKKEEQFLNDFFKRRAKGEEGDTVYYEFSNKEKNLREMFEIDKYEKNYFIFPNVPWDRSIALVGQKVAFDDIYKWVSFTIDFFKKQKTRQLIIKIHPAEIRTDRSEKTLQDYIYEKYGKLPENIKIIPPDTDISAYSLFPLIDVGLVFNGTVGLEMALNNIPVIVTGQVHYSRKGFTYDAKNEDEYLENLSKDLSPVLKQQEIAKIYAYFFFIKSFLPRRFIYYRSFLDLGWQIESIDDLSEGKDKYLDHLCNYITSDIIYQSW
jgi:hypothetical protein